MANEKRLIDANALIAEYCDGCRYLKNKECGNICGVVQLIEETPTVDAVEVVRCKECIGKAHWYKNDYGCTICGMSGLYVVEDRDFCSYGERRDGE